MDKLTRAVVETLSDWGVDLVGIAPVERFANAPEGHRPTDFLPKRKSVIFVGMHLFQGMAHVWGSGTSSPRPTPPISFTATG